MPNDKPKSINEEAGLPDNWVPIDAPPVIPGRPVQALSSADGSSKYLQGSLPPDIQHDTSFVGTGYEGSGVPKLSLMPLNVQGSPVSNAGIQSTSKTTVENPTSTTIINEQGITGIVPVANGGTGTATPVGVTAGANISVVGSFPNQLISATAGGAGGGVSKKVTSYLAVGTDTGTLLTFSGASLTLTLPAVPPSTSWFIDVQNTSTTNLTINPNGLFLDGSLSTLAVGANQGLRIFTDGTNYFTQRGLSGIGTAFSATSTPQTGSLGSLVIVPSTSRSGLWVVNASATATAETDPGGGDLIHPTLSVTVNPSIISSAESFNGITPPVTVNFSFPVGFFTTPFFLPIGSSISISTTLVTGSGGALTYTVTGVATQV